ncbi:MAG TPA: HAD family phosphatase [Candidatus Dormibacteraeota bacterium]|nr:HAD family phosphatase [Candidatus Dormibacteraeota bacterium]
MSVPAAPPARASKTEAVIFDMDGVIVDSEPRHERAFLEVVKQIGYGETHGIRFADYIGRSDKELWVDFVARHKPPLALEELLARKRQVAVELLRQEKPIFAGLPGLVAQLAGSYRLAVATGSERVVAEAVLAIGELTRFFPFIVTGADVERGKPAPDIFLRTAKLLDIPPRNCWVIEDSKLGVAAAVAAGMRVIAITNTYPAAEFSNATHVVSSAREIGAILIGQHERSHANSE